uniref:Uncharacterized protein n=1 Tax=Arundo donax TaxID=35708 RepID=A0A0A9BRV6_ARUDO
MLHWVPNIILCCSEQLLFIAVSYVFGLVEHSVGLYFQSRP